MSVGSAVALAQAIALFDAKRAWTFAVGLATLCGIGVVLVLSVDGDPLAQRIHSGAIALTGAASVLYAATMRNPGSYRRWKVWTVGYVAMLANGTGFYFWGVYSAFIAFVAVSVYAFASGSGRSVGILVAAIALHCGLGVAQLVGWMDDRGLVSLPIGSTADNIAILIVLQLIVVAAMLAGEQAHRAMMETLRSHDLAVRRLAVRDAQLAEAHEAARVAMRPGAGRHTGSLLGRFRIGEILGRGAMGEVYAAQDERGGRCAVKVLAPQTANDDDALRRLHREAHAIARLDAPNIVRMLEVSPPSAPISFLAMELLQGQDLAAILKDQPVLAAGEVVAIMRAVAAGLDAAHAAGVVHRDLKPANVFASRVGNSVEWKILDFGVSRQLGELTMTGARLIGTPGYMAPEQARMRSIDHRVDIYALGILAYRLLTGRPAVIPGDIHAMIHEVIYRMPPQPGQIVAMSPQTEAVLAIALAKSPDDRFASAGEFSAALAESVAGVLPEHVLRRARTLLRRAPWGHWIGVTQGRNAAPPSSAAAAT